MAEKDKIPNKIQTEHRVENKIHTSRLSESASYTIGGRMYKAYDMNKINTARDTLSENVHVQTGRYKPSVNTQASIQETPIQRVSLYRPPETIPTYSSPGPSAIQSRIQTDDDMARMARNRIQSQTEHFYSSNFRESGVTEVRNLNQMNRSVDGIRTGSSIHSISSAPRTPLTVGTPLTVSSINYPPNVPRVNGTTFDYLNVSNKEYIQGLGVVAGYNIKTEAIGAMKNWNNGILTSGNAVIGKTESTLQESSDLGTQSSGGVIAAGRMGVAGYKMAGYTGEVGIDTVKKVGNGVYQVTTTTGKTVITVGRTAQTIINQQVVPISREAVSILRNQAIRTGLNQTQMAQSIVTKVENVQRIYHKASQGVRQVGRTIHTAVDTSVRIVRGVTQGTLTIQTARTTLQMFRNRMVNGIKTGIRHGIRTGAGYVVRGTSVGATRLITKGIPKATIGIGSALASVDDYAVKGVGYTILTADAGIKTGAVGAKATTQTVKTAVKVGKGVVRGGKATYVGVKFIKDKGLRAAWDRARVRIARKLADAGKSLVSLIITSAKLLGRKILVPVLIVAVFGMVIMGGLSAPLSFVTTIFGGVFSTSDSGKDYEVRDYLIGPNGIPSLTGAFKQNLADQMQSSAGNHDIVRFYDGSGSGEIVDPSYSGVDSVFPNDNSLVNMIHPMFNAVILMDYELEPTEAEAKNLLDEMFHQLFRITTSESREQCGQALDTGEGTVTTHECGAVHALDDCPNPVTGTHTTYTCEDCCDYYYTCRGHRNTLICGNNSKNHTHSPWYNANRPGCYGTYYHRGQLNASCGNSERHFQCSGYKNCDGHSVISYTLTMDGVYALEKKYFIDPIESLSNTNPRTDEQETQLENLKDYYSIYKEMMSEVAVQFGGGMTMQDLSNVNFVNGTRVKNQAIIDLALSQVGQQGGYPYWSYCGFGGRVEWCGCFVYWCMMNTPSAREVYSCPPNPASCSSITQHYMQLGQWGNGSFTNVTAGDMIFFDWDLSGDPDHVGLVIGRDENYVYTVEGNSGDAVACMSYPLGSSVIYGYGLMNYK